MSVVPSNSLKKDFFKRDGSHVYRHRAQRTRLVEDGPGSRARQYGEHTALAPDALDARRAECRLRRLSIEHELDTAEILPQLVERPRDHRAATIDDGDVVGDLVDFGDLVRGEE